MRRVSVPEVLRLVDGPSETASALASLVPPKGGSLLIVSSPTPFSALGARLCGELRADHLLIGGNAYAEVQKVMEYLFVHESAIVVGVGGGRVIDVAKLAAHYTRRTFVSVPTQVSHDGIASPIAVIEHPSTGVTSIGATAPEAVVVPLSTVLTAPEQTIRAGVGDLLGKLTALQDWRLAVAAGKDEFDDYAALLAELSVEHAFSFLSNARRPKKRDRAFVSFLTRSLIMSGIAMTIAGSSRPCSGSEHLISHAIDSLFGGRALHGEQVAVGTVAALVIQGRPDEARRLAALYRRLGLPTSPADIGLGDDEFLAALHEAPRTRPNRYTILSRLQADGEPSAIESLLREGLIHA